MRKLPPRKTGGARFWEASTQCDALDDLINEEVVTALRESLDNSAINMPFDWYPYNGSELSNSPRHHKLPGDPLTVRLRDTLRGDWYYDFNLRGELLSTFNACAEDGSYLAGCELMHAELVKLTSRLGKLLEQGRKAKAERGELDEIPQAAVKP